MISCIPAVKTTAIPLAAAMAAILALSCALPPPPEKVDESRPTVTYKYSSDQELVEVRPVRDASAIAAVTSSDLFSAGVITATISSHMTK